MELSNFLSQVPVPVLILVILVKENISHTPWVSSDAWGIFLFAENEWFR